MRRLVAVFLLLTPVALAAPDLSVKIASATLVPGTTSVQFIVTVTNASNETANMENTGYGPIDVLFFANEPSQPIPSSNTTDFICQPAYCADALPPVMAAQESRQFVFKVDYEVPGNYAAWVVVDSVALVPGLSAWPEITKMNNVAGPTLVTVPDVADPDSSDLVITALQAAVAGVNVKYTATVSNQGAVASKSGPKLDIVTNAPGGVCPPPGWSDPEPTPFGDIFLDVPALPPGGSHNFEKIVKLSPGTHLGCAAVDLDRLEAESDETNNWRGPVTAVVTDSGPLDCADLDVSLFQVGVVADEVTFEVRVKNLGGVASSPVAVDLFRNALSTPVAEQTADHVFTLSALAPGEEKVLTHVWSAASNAQRTAWVWIDSDVTTFECDTANNLEGPFPYVVDKAPERPDLVVEQLHWAPKANALCYDVTVRNAGVKASPEFTVDMFYSLETAPAIDADLSGIPGGYLTAPALEPGATTSVEFCWDTPTAGDHKVWAALDFLALVEESDETNNIYGPVVTTFVPLVTAGPDLVLMEFRGQVRCNLVDYIALVCNRGDTDAQRFAVDIYFDANDNPGYLGTKYGPGDETVFYGSLDGAPGLVAGECLDVILRREGTPSGVYQSWLVVDTNLEVPEETPTNPLGEGNNIGRVTVAVDSEGCACAVNTLITELCLCGEDTVESGYCCNGEWQTEAFEVCVPDDGIGDDGGQSGDDGGGGTVDGGGGEVVGADGSSGSFQTLDSLAGLDEQPGDGCVHGRRGGSNGLFLGAALLLLGLGRRFLGRSSAKSLTR